MNEESDANLVKLAQNGDQKAFQVLVERYQRKVFNICYGMVRNRDDAMDLVQETFVKVFRNLGRFKGDSSFYTWVYRIAKNAGIDHIRKAKRNRTVDYDDAIRRDENVEDDTLLPSALGINPARVMARKELLGRIEDALGELSDNHREVIILREVQGLSYQEIADIAEISIGTVMSRLHHARRNMQALLADYVGSELKVDDPAR